jgi:uncharacterized RDD family membrane protein YckC
MNKVNTLRIRTPEGITFSLLLAGPVSRFLAWLVDALLVLVTSVLLSSTLMVLSVVSPDFGQALTLLLIFAFRFGYGIAAEWYWRGQTVGKKVMNLRVVDAEGLKLQPAQIIVRNLLRAVDSLPLFYLVGGTALVLSKRAQRLGDLAANTIVIREPKLVQPDVDQLLSGKFNSLRQHPHLEARLRQRITAAEATLALQALVRRDELDPAARVAVFGQLANHFRSVVEFPPEAVEGLADEQYVRNVVDILFRPRGEKSATEPMAVMASAR